RYVVPPFVDPYDPNMDPLVPAQINALGATIAAELTARGREGVATSIIFDAYSPSRAYQHYHGGVRILSEAASVKIATPVTLTAEQLVETRGFAPNVRSHNHPVPWQGGTWTLRDIVENNLIASWALLNHAAHYREQWTRNFDLIQRRSLSGSRPFAFVVMPYDLQPDPVATAEMLDVLRSGAVEMHLASSPFVADGVEFPEGSFVVPMSQPFGGYAKTLLEVQEYPELRLFPGGPPKPPYDIAAHTLPLQMGVSAIRVESPFGTPGEAVSEVPRPIGGIEYGTAPFLLAAESNAASRLVNRILANGGSVSRTTSPIIQNSRVVGAGAFVIDRIGQTSLNELASAAGLCIRGLSNASDAPRVGVAAPRVGLYRSWRPNAVDAGWTAMVLDEYGFNITVLRDKAIRQGNLGEACDVIILPHELPKDILEGNSVDEYPSEFAGGIGELGAANLRRFVEEGGTLVALDAACDVAIHHLYLPVTNVLENLRHDEFYSPGSLLRILVNPNHPLGWGFERESVAMFVSSPAFEVRSNAEQEALVVAHYPLTNPLLSGWILGSERIAGRAAVVEVRVGRGRAILIGIRPQFRAQARVTYKLLFNALYLATLEQGQVDPRSSAR
ncbi:MAG: hypothetical protein M3R06_02565, partial [Chloroflexota bacterium]|nr:hypothetical protein [Chloroflexota bacterium]